MTLRLAYQYSITRLLIDRPDKRNAFNQAMWDALPVLLAQAAEDPAARVIILQSATPGLFCAGADIGEMLENANDADWRAANQVAIERAQHELARVDRPVIGFIDGDCIGGGCGLALACDLRIATPRARFGITPAKLGIVYPLHDTKLLVDLVGPAQAKRLLFTGALIGADEALRIGLIDMIADEPDTLAGTIASVSAHSVREAKKAIRRILEGQMDEDAQSRAVFAEAFTLPDFREGASAFVEKRKPDFR